MSTNFYDVQWKVFKSGNHDFAQLKLLARVLTREVSAKVSLAEKNSYMAQSTWRFGRQPLECCV